MRVCFLLRKIGNPTTKQNPRAVKNTISRGEAMYSVLEIQRLIGT